MEPPQAPRVSAARYIEGQGEGEREESVHGELITENVKLDEITKVNLVVKEEQSKPRTAVFKNTCAREARGPCG